MTTRLRRGADDGFTLVELLIATTLMVIIVGALVAALLLALQTSIGLSSASTVNKQDTNLISAQIEAHIGIQALSRYFNADINDADYPIPSNPPNPTDVHIVGDSPAPDVQCARPSPDPTLGTETKLVQIDLRNPSDTTSPPAVKDRITYVYSVDAHSHYGQIARYDCHASGGAASAVVTTRGLSTTVAPQISRTAPTPSVPSYVFSLTVTTVAGRTYKIDASPAVDVSSAGGGGGSGQSPPTPFTSILMQDAGANGTTHNGVVDRIVVNYDSSVTLTSSCATGWSLGGNVPSGGTMGAVTVSNSAHTITLAISEGSGAPDTSVGSLVVNFNPSASCTLLGFSNLVPIDDAQPVVIAVTQPAGNNGKMEPGDSFAIQFSEPLDPSTVPSQVNVTETNPNSGNDTISVSGILQGNVSLGSADYFTGATPNGATATYPANVTTDSATAPTTLTVTIPTTVVVAGVNVPTPCTGVGCPTLANGTGLPAKFVPANSLQSLATTPASTTAERTPTTLTANPPPLAGFRMF